MTSLQTDSISPRRRRPLRQDSNGIAMFDEKQINEFREVFAMLDTDGDGYIGGDDLKKVFGQLGQSPSSEYISSMIAEAPSSINFTMFLTLFGEKMGEIDSEREIIQALECFDENGGGLINADHFRQFMTTTGDRLDDDEIEMILRDLHVDANGNFDYHELAKTLRLGASGSHIK